MRARQLALDAGIRESQSELERIDQSSMPISPVVYFGVELAANVERTRRSVMEQADRQLDRARRFEKSRHDSRGLTAERAGGA